MFEQLKERFRTLKTESKKRFFPEEPSMPNKYFIIKWREGIDNHGISNHIGKIILIIENGKQRTSPASSEGVPYSPHLVNQLVADGFIGRDLTGGLDRPLSQISPDSLLYVPTGKITIPTVGIRGK
jgi:hypothetical protein